MYQYFDKNLTRQFVSRRFLSMVQINLKTAIFGDWLSGILRQYDIGISLVDRPAGQYHDYLVVFNLKVVRKINGTN